MNKIAIFFAVIAVAAAQAPGQTYEGSAQVLRSDSTVNPDSFRYAYETSNGIAAQEQGQLKQIGAEAGIAVQGEYSYTGPDGILYRVTYIADENGFQPQGAHLQVAPDATPALRTAPVIISPAAPVPFAPQGFQFQRRF